MMKKVIATSALMAFGVVAALGNTTLAQTTQPATQDQIPTTRPANQPGSTQLSTFDRQFMTKAAQGGMAEVELSRLALQRSKSNQVKQFAQRMITDHTQANAQLMQLAQQKGVRVPRTLDAQHQQIRARLQRLSGNNFDREYMSVMDKDHDQTVNLFQSATQQAQDPDVNTFANNTLPKLQDHLQMVQAMRGNNSAQNSHSQQH
jgi:putative membrane protein